MTLLTTSTNVAGITPAQYGPLIIQPVTQASVAMSAATLIATGSSTFLVPVLRHDVGSAWVAEGAEIAPSDALFDEIVVTPAKVAGLSIISVELANDSSPDAQTLVGNSIARSIAKTIDKAWLQTMAAPAPSGLTGLSGANAPSAVSAGTAWSSTDPFAEAISDVEVSGGTVTAFIAHPADVLALAKLKAGSQLATPLLGLNATTAEDRSILGVPLISNNQATQGTIWGIAGDRVITVMRTDMTLAVSTDAYFSSDRVGIKVTLRIGFAFPAPASIAKISLTSGV